VSHADDLAPLERLFLRPIELTPSQDIVTALVRSHDAILDFLAWSVRERVLPSGVRLIQPAFVHSATEGLNLHERALIVGALDASLARIVLEMARVSALNRTRKASYYQRVGQHSPGIGASALICSHGSPLTESVPDIEIAHIAYRNPPQISDLTIPDDFWTLSRGCDGQEGAYSITLSDVDEGCRQTPGASASVNTPPIDTCTVILTGGRASCSNFEQFVRNHVESDTEYLRHISSLVSHATVIVAVPRPLHVKGAADQLGTAGLTFLFDPGHPLTPDLIRRCVLLADRVTSFFSLAANVYRAAEVFGQRNALELVAHSLDNAICNVADGTPETARATLLVEYITLQAARFAISGNQCDSAQSAWCRFGVPFETTLRTALGHRGRNLVLEASCLHRYFVDTRFMAALVELSRNIAKRSPAKGGSITISLTTDGRLSLESRNNCAFGDYERARTQLEWAGSPDRSSPADRLQQRGLILFLEFLESQSDARSSLRICIGQKGDAFTPVLTGTLRSGARISLEAGTSIEAAAKEQEQDRSTEANFQWFLRADYLQIGLRRGQDTC
jgi:hypothetical protein